LSTWSGVLFAIACFLSSGSTDALQHEAVFVPLAKEIEFLKGYLEMEQVRFGDRLTVDMQIALEVLGAGVPYLILHRWWKMQFVMGLPPAPAAHALHGLSDDHLLRVGVFTAHFAASQPQVLEDRPATTGAREVSSLGRNHADVVFARHGEEAPRGAHHGRQVCRRRFAVDR
jgi:hypothetical protein